MGVLHESSWQFLFPAPVPPGHPPAPSDRIAGTLGRGALPVLKTPRLPIGGWLWEGLSLLVSPWSPSLGTSLSLAAHNTTSHSPHCVHVGGGQPGAADRGAVTRSHDPFCQEEISKQTSHQQVLSEELLEEV